MLDYFHIVSLYIKENSKTGSTKVQRTLLCLPPEVIHHHYPPSMETQSSILHNKDWYTTRDNSLNHRNTQVHKSYFCNRLYMFVYLSYTIELPVHCPHARGMSHGLRLKPRKPWIIYTSMGKCIEICTIAPTTKTNSSNWNWNANTEVVCGYCRKQLMMLEYAIGNDTTVLSIWEASVCGCTSHLGGQCDLYVKRLMLGGPPKHQKWMVR